MIRKFLGWVAVGALLAAIPCIVFAQSVAQYAITIGDAAYAGFINLSDGSSNYATITAPSLSANYTLTLPVDDGTSGQVLATDGDGALSWETGTGALTIADTAVPYASAADTLTGDDTNFVWDDTANANFLKLGSGTSPGELRFLEGSGGGTNYTGFKAPATLAGNVAYTLPSADGSAGQFLKTDGSKVLSWTSTLTTPVIGVATGTSLAVTGALTTSSPSAAFGYAPGAGSTVIQATDKSTTVVINARSGTIVTDAAALNAGVIVSFTCTNSALTTNSLFVVQHVSGGTVGSYGVTAVGGNGTGTIYIRNNTAGNLSEALTLRFAIIEAPAA